MIDTKAVMSSLHNDPARVESLRVLSRFRTDFYACLSARGDALFEATDALLCAEGPVHSLVGLVLAPEHRRGHGALYDGLNAGRIAVRRLRTVLAGLPLPRAAGGRLVLAVDVSPWLRPGADTSPDRLFCHVYGRSKDTAQLIPGWPYSIVAALETGRSSWTAVLDAQRLGPHDDVAAVTATQLRDLVARLVTAGQWTDGDPDILIVADAGYDLPRLAFELADLPVEVLGRLRTDRVLCLPTPPRTGRAGRPARHGGLVHLDDPATWPDPPVTTTCDTTRYGTATATAWDRLHPRLTRRAAWIHHNDALPILEGTLIRLVVEHLPGNRHPKPMWLWSSHTSLTAAQVDLLWQAYLRRFDLEHTFRLFKQTLGWTTPKLRDPEAADRWTWLVIAAHTQLRLARTLTHDLRRPWERPCPPDRLTPARTRRGFRYLHPKTTHPAGAPKPTTPGPGRPPGSKNHRPAPHHHVGKLTKRELTATNRQQGVG
jgi:DDE superfamily endonuclease